MIGDLGCQSILDTATGRRLFCLRYNQLTSALLARCPGRLMPADTQPMESSGYRIPCSGVMRRAGKLVGGSAVLTAQSVLNAWCR